MQINIDKKTGIFSVVIVVLVAVIAFMAISHNDSTGISDMEHSSMGDEASAVNSRLEGSDVMFLQMMIPHHQQAIDISNLALKSSQDKELLALAQTIIDEQSAEILHMEAWLRDGGASMDMGHSMDGMGGMLSEVELSQLLAAMGKNFDRLWLKGMIGHHDGAVHMTTMIRDARNPVIKAFGEDVVKVQTAQIEQMKVMLKRIQ